MEITVVSELDIPGLAERLDAAVPGTRLRLLGPDEAPATLAGEVLLSPTNSLRAGALAAAMPRLAWIHVFGTGIDRFPVAEVPAGVAFSCSRGASAAPIAEWAIACMLAFEKQLPQRWLSEPPGQWWMAELGTLAGRTLAIAGLGGIGEALARRALAFDMEVVALARRTRAHAPPGVRMVAAKEALLEAADHLVLCLPATPATRHFLDREAFARLRPGAHLVNVARGALVDQEALREALDAGTLAGASLDCVEPEPLPPGHWLYAHPRVRLSAHVSWSEPLAFPRLLEAFTANLRRFAAGEALHGVVDREQGY